MRATLEQFVEFFVHEFMEELWYLQKVARGDIPRRSEAADPWEKIFNVTQALLSLAPIPGLPAAFMVLRNAVNQGIDLAEQVHSVIQQALDGLDTLQGSYEWLAGKGSSTPELSDIFKKGVLDLKSMRFLAELLARGLSQRYEHALTKILDTTHPETSTILLAREGAQRCFQYLQSKPFLDEKSRDIPLLEQRIRLMDSVVLGKIVKSWREQCVDTAMHILPRWMQNLGKELPIKKDLMARIMVAKKKESLKGAITPVAVVKSAFSAQAIYSRCAWYYDIPTPCYQSIVKGEKTSWYRDTRYPLRHPKYGYAYLEDAKYLPPFDEKKIEKVELKSDFHFERPSRNSRFYQPITVTEIEAYLESKELKKAREKYEIAKLTFHEFLHKEYGYPHDCQAVCHDDLSAISLAFGNFKGVDFSGATISKDIAGCCFDETYLVSTSFKNISRSQDNPAPSFIKANMAHAQLARMPLARANLTQANLSFANLNQAQLTGTYIIGVKWYKTQLDGIKEEDLLIEYKKAHKDLEDELKTWRDCYEKENKTGRAELQEWRGSMDARVEFIEKEWQAHINARIAFIEKELLDGRDLLLMPELPIECSRYKFKYIIINYDTDQFFYINSKAEAEKIEIDNPSLFREKLERLINKGPIISDMKREETQPKRKRERCSFQENHIQEVQKNLTERDVRLGSAYGEGDCFFDAIAQGIEAAGIAIPGLTEYPGYKKLRVIGNTYLKAHKQEDKNWVKEAISADAKEGGSDWNTCLMTMQYTQPEIEEKHRSKEFEYKMATYGRPHIEGRIICEQLKMKLHVVEIEEVELGEDQEAKKLIFNHQLVDDKNSKTVKVSAIDYTDNRIIHILVYKNHFVPAFSIKLFEKLEREKLESKHFSLKRDLFLVSLQEKQEIKTSKIKEFLQQNKKLQPKPIVIIKQGKIFTLYDQLDIGDWKPVRVLNAEKLNKLKFEDFSTVSPFFEEENEKLIIRLSILTARKDEILRKMEEGRGHSRLDKELEVRLKEISQVETMLKEISKKELMKGNTALSDNMVTKAVDLMPISTKGGGDCAFHAILGQWDASAHQIVCTDIKEKRAQLRAAIMNPDVKEPLQGLIVEGIKELIMSGRQIGGSSQALLKRYREFLADQKELSSMTWFQVEIVLQKHKVIIEYIRENHSLASTASFRDQFYDALNKKEGELYGRMLSLPDLHEAFQEYSQLQNTAFDWLSTILGSESIKTEYADFVGTSQVWLLPSELAIIAHVFDVSVIYCPSPGALPLTLNPKGASIVEVQFDGIGHFERLQSTQYGSVFILPSCQVPSDVYQEIVSKQGQTLSIAQRQQTSIHLTSEQVNDLITLNGGHIPLDMVGELQQEVSDLRENVIQVIAGVGSSQQYIEQEIGDSINELQSSMDKYEQELIEIRAELRAKLVAPFKGEDDKEKEKIHMQIDRLTSSMQSLVGEKQNRLDLEQCSRKILKEVQKNQEKLESELKSLRESKSDIDKEKEKNIKNLETEIKKLADKSSALDIEIKRLQTERDATSFTLELERDIKRLSEFEQKITQRVVSMEGYIKKLQEMCFHDEAWKNTQDQVKKLMRQQVQRSLFEDHCRRDLERLEQGLLEVKNTQKKSVLSDQIKEIQTEVERSQKEMEEKLSSLEALFREFKHGREDELQKRIIELESLGRSQNENVQRLEVRVNSLIDIIAEMQVNYENRLDNYERKLKLITAQFQERDQKVIAQVRELTLPFQKIVEEQRMRLLDQKSLQRNLEELQKRQRGTRDQQQQLLQSIQDLEKEIKGTDKSIVKKIEELRNFEKNITGRIQVLEAFLKELQQGLPESVAVNELKRQVAEFIQQQSLRLIFEKNCTQNMESLKHDLQNLQKKLDIGMIEFLQKQTEEMQKKLKEMQDSEKSKYESLEKLFKEFKQQQSKELFAHVDSLEHRFEQLFNIKIENRVTGALDDIDKTFAKVREEMWEIRAKVDQQDAKTNEKFKKVRKEIKALADKLGGFFSEPLGPVYDTQPVEYKNILSGQIYICIQNMDELSLAGTLREIKQLKLKEELLMGKYNPFDMKEPPAVIAASIANHLNLKGEKELCSKALVVVKVLLQNDAPRSQSAFRHYIESIAFRHPELFDEELRKLLLPILIPEVTSVPVSIQSKMGTPVLSKNSDEKSAENYRIKGKTAEEYGEFQIAENFYRQAAEAGSVRALVNLGIFALQGKARSEPAPTEAYGYFKQAAEAEHGRGMYLLACALEKGEGVVQNKSAALELFQKIAEKEGHSELGQAAKSRIDNLTRFNHSFT